MIAWNYVIISIRYKYLKHTTVYKLFLLDKHTWYHMTVYKKTLKNITKCKYRCTMNAISHPLDIK